MSAKSGGPQIANPQSTTFGKVRKSNKLCNKVREFAESQIVELFADHPPLTITKRCYYNATYVSLGANHKIKIIKK
jgi:hypothetical protein